MPSKQQIRKKEGFAICDLDFKSAFDFLSMERVLRVLTAKRMHPQAVSRLRRYHTDTVPIVNNVQGRKIINKDLL